jgi:hypothetical protein
VVTAPLASHSSFALGGEALLPHQPQRVSTDDASKVLNWSYMLARSLVGVLVAYLHFADRLPSVAIGCHRLPICARAL